MDPVLAAILTAIGVIGAAWVTARVSARRNASDAGQQMIDQHQEDIAALRAAGVEQERRIARLEKILRIQGDYIGQLRRHISDGQPPPPPPYPEGLIT